MMESKKNNMTRVIVALLLSCHCVDAKRRGVRGAVAQHYEEEHEERRMEEAFRGFHLMFTDDIHLTLNDESLGFPSAFQDSENTCVPGTGKKVPFICFSQIKSTPDNPVGGAFDWQVLDHPIDPRRGPSDCVRYGMDIALKNFSRQGSPRFLKTGNKNFNLVSGELQADEIEFDSGENSFAWNIRSSEGFASDPKHGQCVKRTDTIFLVNQKDQKYLSYKEGRVDTSQVARDWIIGNKRPSRPIMYQDTIAFTLPTLVDGDLKLRAVGFDSARSKLVASSTSEDEESSEWQVQESNKGPNECVRYGDSVHFTTDDNSRRLGERFGSLVANLRTFNDVHVPEDHYRWIIWSEAAREFTGFNGEPRVGDCVGTDDRIFVSNLGRKEFVAGGFGNGKNLVNLASSEELLSPSYSIQHAIWSLDHLASATDSPSANPTASPTSTPTISPTSSPTLSPTASPTGSPASPTESPTSSPTLSPTASPTESPTALPTNGPTASPTGSPVTDGSTDSQGANAKNLPAGGVTRSSSPSFLIRNGQDKSLCLDVKDGKSTEGQNVNINRCDTRSATQKWLTAKNGSIQSSVNPELCISVKSGEINAAVTLEACDAKNRNQQWAQQKSGLGVQFRSQNYRFRAFGVTNGCNGVATGRNVKLQSNFSGYSRWRSRCATQQNWKLEEVA